MLPEPFNLIPTSARRQILAQKDDVIFRQSDPTRGLYFLASGQVEMRRFTETGFRVVIHLANGGETFAEASMFSDCYHCDGVALTQCNIIEIDRNCILDKFHNDGNFALAVTRRFAQQNQNYRRKLMILAIKNAEERIIAAIEEGLLGDNIRVFSSEIGLTHETVYRGLAKLTAKKLIHKKAHGKYEIGPM